MKNTKRMLAAFLAAALLFCMLPASSAFAAEARTSGKIGDNLTWKLKGSTLVISGKGKMSIDYDYTSFPWYAHRQSIEKVVVKDGVTSVSNGAFYLYKNVSSISLADSVMDVDGNAFYGTAWYKAQKKGVIYLNKIACGYRGVMQENAALQIKDGTKAIGSSAFTLSDLSSVFLPDSVTYIGEEAFSRSHLLTEVRVPQTLQYVGGYAFWDTPWLEFQPDGVVYLGKVAYGYHGEMQPNTAIKLRRGTVSISATAFFQEENLTKIQIPESVTTIGYDAFRGSGIKTLSIPKSVREIEDNKLGAIFSKKIVVDPENPVYSSDETGCLFNKDKTVMYEYPGFNKTKTYRIPGTVKTVQVLCFDNTLYLETLVIPASVRHFDEDAVDRSCYLKAFRVSKKNPNYASDSVGCLYNKDKSTLIRYPIGAEYTAFTVPKQVKTIGKYAFIQAGTLQTLTMSDHVTTIGEFALYRCYGLENIRFSKNITNIEGELFAYIPWLEKQPDGVIYIGKVAYTLKGDVKDVVVKNGTVSVAPFAFAGCEGLRTVVLPKSVKRIGCGAFENVRTLKSVRIENPDCRIVMQKETFPKKTTIIGVKDSTAQQYAESFGRTFKSI